jgi:hypothetical protein
MVKITNRSRTLTRRILELECQRIQRINKVRECHPSECELVLLS